MSDDVGGPNVVEFRTRRQAQPRHPQDLLEHAADYLRTVHACEERRGDNRPPGWWLTGDGYDLQMRLDALREIAETVEEAIELLWYCDA